MFSISRTTYLKKIARFKFFDIKILVIALKIAVSTIPSCLYLLLSFLDMFFFPLLLQLLYSSQLLFMPHHLEPQISIQSPSLTLSIIKLLERGEALLYKTCQLIEEINNINDFENIFLMILEK